MLRCAPEIDRRRRPAAAGLAVALTLLLWQPGASAEAAADAVRARLQALQASWNRGDMAGYLANYHRDADLVLSFGNTIVEGWDRLDALFRSSYPDPPRMGRFTIDRLQVKLLGDDAAIAFGNFTHVFPTETIKGGFSQVLTPDKDGSWRIRHERTSRGEVLHTAD